MPTIGFRGRILPELSMLNIKNLPAIGFREEPRPPELLTALDMMFAVSIDSSQIFVQCTVDPYEESLFTWAFRRVTSLLRIIVDLYSFSTGESFVVIFEKYIDPLGIEKDIRMTAPHLSGVSTVQTVDQSIPGSIKTGNLLALVFREWPLAAAIRDLISGLEDANMTAVDCARAIDGLRAIFVPDPDKKKEGWHLLRCNLCLSEDYINLIMKTSQRPRHGNREYVSGAVLREITTRSWTIMNRFLEFRLRGSSSPLPLSEFPLL